MTVAAAPIKLADKGVTTGGADCTAQVNAVIDQVNAAGAPAALVWPMGQVACGALHPVTASQVWHVSEAGVPGLSRVKQLGGTLFTWGTDGAVVDGGGMVNMAIDGNDDPAQPAINAYNSARLVFDELESFKVGFLAKLDGGVGRTCAQMTFKRLHGYCSPVAAPLIYCGVGQGLRITDADVMSSSPPSGRTFLSFNGSWDTVSLIDPWIQQFDTCVTMPNITPGMVVQSVQCRGGYWDGCVHGGFVANLSGGALYALDIDGVEIAPPQGGGVLITGTGLLDDTRVKNCRVLQAAHDGVLIIPEATVLDVSGNTFYAVGQGGPAAGINLRGRITDARLIGNTVTSNAVGGAGLPTYGLIVQVGGDGCTFIGNRFAGSASNSYVAPMTNSTARGNVGLADF